MCAIVGITNGENVAQQLYDALIVQQHRGQDAAGIMTSEVDATVHLRKDNGLVSDVFRKKDMKRLLGPLGLGHCRYPTAGCDSAEEAQPFFVNSPYGIALVHNGNITNADRLKTELFEKEHRHVNTTSDSEVILNVFAHELSLVDKVRLTPEDIFLAVSKLHQRLEGAYALIAMITGYGIVAIRDPFGIRPLCFGVKEVDHKKYYMFASESVALDSLGYKFVRDVLPGEAIFVDKHGNFSSKECAQNPVYSPCAFEYVYLARPDSVIDGISVYEARSKMGVSLAKNIAQTMPDHDIDVVMPIPDSGRTAAWSMANELGIEYQEGFVKNRYIGRTFIMPAQEDRQNSIKKKLNPIAKLFQGKNVLLVDDSIVRGNTSRKIVQLAREAGAKKVYFASAAPPVVSPNVCGIDMPTREELVAHNRTIGEIADYISADRLIYQRVEDLEECILSLNPDIKRLDLSCFTGEYVTKNITDEYLEQLHHQRSIKNKK